MRGFEHYVRCALIIVVSLASLAGCPGAVGPDGGPTCPPGTERPCTCTNGAAGTQACASDGAAGTCACASPLDAAVDVTDLDAAEDASTAGTFGAPCTMDRECASNICLVVGHCSRPCMVRSDCPASSNWQCLNLPARGQICACAGIAGMTERSCNGVDDDCDGVIDEGSITCDGMCVDSARDIRNCGSCGLACGGAQVCRNGACGCPPERSSVCAAMCVDLQTDVMNCGRCGTACRAGPTETPACVAGSCTLMCPVGSGDCDRNPSNGCEADTTSSLSNCGSCGRACTFTNATGTCSSGACVIGACAAGFGDCDGNPSNGCETATGASLAHCGACSRACAPANGIGVCTGGVCDLALCSMGFANCNSDPADGCEVNLPTSPTNCGSCGRVCPGGSGTPHTTAGCSAGVCTIACTAGFGDCDGNAANGCETDVTTTERCGGCSVVCASGQTCTAGACTCPGGGTVCSGTCRNTSSDPSNCGSCGRVCPVGQVCNSGTCSTTRFSGATGTTWELISAGGGVRSPGYTDYSPAGATAFYASGDSAFSRHDTIGGTWMPSSPAVGASGMIGYFAGPAWVGSRLYLVLGRGAYAFDIGGTSWTTLIASSVSTISGSQSTHDDTGHVYAVTLDDRIATYDIVSNTVRYQAFGMSPPVVYPRIAWDSVSRLLYVVPTVANSNLYSFDPATGAIRALAGIPKTRFDPSFCADRSGHLYATGDNAGFTVWQYTIATNTWVALAATLPFSHDANGACTVTDSGYLYLSDTGSRLARLRLM